MRNDRKHTYVYTAAGLLVAILLAMAGQVRADEFIAPLPSWKDVKKDFGAVGDGKADDTAALQKALDELGMGTLYLPAGTYRITATLKMKGRKYVNLIGEHPDKTCIRWDGEDGGIMHYLNGVAYSRWERITWDGAGKARTAIDHEWDLKTHPPGTGNQHSEEVFKDVAFGLRFGRPHSMDAECAILRCQFLRCETAGLSIESMNALDIWVWNAWFEDCGRAATNAAEGEYGGGHFHVYNSVMLRSKDADFVTGHTSYFGIRNNLSIGSRMFYRSLRPKGIYQTAGRHKGKHLGRWTDKETYGSCLVLQGNTIIDPLEANAIQFMDNGPAVLIGNTIRSRSDAKAPIVTINPPSGDPSLTLFGNTFTVANPAKGRARIVEQGTKILAPADIQAKLPVPLTPHIVPHVERKIINVSFGKDATKNAEAFQAAINEAAKLNGQRPVVFIPSGKFTLNRTVTIPAGCDLQVVGNGFSSTLGWAGDTKGPVLRLEGPSRATLREFTIHCGPAKWIPPEESAVGIVITKCDQPGGRIFLQQPQAQNFSSAGFLVDGIKNTRIDMQNMHSSDSNPGIRVVGAGKNTPSRVGLYGAITTNNDVSYDVRNGGRLLIWDAWYEGEPKRFIDLNDSGELIFSGGMVSPSNRKKEANELPGILADGFDGTLVVSSALLNTKVEVRNPKPSTRVFAFSNYSTANDPVYVDPSKKSLTVLNCNRASPTGHLPLADIGQDGPEQIGKALSAMAQDMPLTWPLASVEPGKTDLRIYRTFVRFGSIGYHFQP